MVAATTGFAPAPQPQLACAKGSVRGHGAFSINVHRAEPDLPIIACGDIPPA